MNQQFLQKASRGEAPGLCIFHVASKTVQAHQQQLGQHNERQASAGRGEIGLGGGLDTKNYGLCTCGLLAQYARDRTFFLWAYVSYW